MWVVGQLVGLDLWVRWVVVWRLVGFSWLFDGGSSRFGTLGAGYLMVGLEFWVLLDSMVFFVFLL